MQQEAPETPEKNDAKPFVIKVRWVVIAVLIYMLIFNYLLFKDATTDKGSETELVE